MIQEAPAIALPRPLLACSLAAALALACASDAWPQAQTLPGATDTGNPPDTMGAVGPNNLMVTANGGVWFRDRTGAIQRFESDNQFWHATGAYSGTEADLSDPLEAYDPYSNRFMAAQTAYPLASNSVILVAVSATSDPTGAWYGWQVRIDNTGTVGADQPRIGFNKSWIVVTVTVGPVNASYTNGTYVYVFNKASLYAGTGQPNSPAYTLFTYYPTDDIIEPASTLDSALATEYMVQSNAAVSNLTLYAITGAVGSESVSQVGNYASTIGGWSTTGPNAPQLGAANTLDTGDDRISSAVYRNGSLWCAHTVFLPAGAPNRSSAQWWQLNATSPGAVQQMGRIDDATAARFYAYPSVAVNSANNALVGGTVFSATTWPSAMYAVRLSTDTAGTLETPVVYKQGTGAFNDGGNPSRWGDYSASAVDPLNDSDLWTIQEYAVSSSAWATEWARVSFAPPGPPSPPTGGVTTAQGTSSVTLSWNDPQTYNQVVVLDSTDGTHFNTLATLSGSPTSLTVNYGTYGLAAGTAYFWKVRGVTGGGSADSGVFGSCLVGMTAPASNTAVAQGAMVTLSWTGSATASAVVSLRATSGGSTTTLATGQAASGSFSWNTTGVAAGTYTITATISDGMNTGTSTAAGTVTIAVVVAAPWSDSFESGNLNSGGWSVSPNTSRWGARAAGNVSGGTFTPIDGSYSAWWFWSPTVSNYDEGLLTPFLSLGGVNNPQLSYKLLLSNYSTTTVESLEVDLQVFGSGTWTVLKSYSNQQGSFTDNNETVSLASWASQTVQIRFRVTGGNSFNINWWELDSVSVAAGAQPPPPPTGGVTTAQGSSSVALNWTDGQTYSQVVVLDSTDGTSFSTLTTLNGSPTSLAVNYGTYGLTAGTAYFWKVRGLASNGLSADSSVFGSCLVNMTAPASNVSVTQGAPVTLSWIGSATASASVTLNATAGGSTTTLATGQAVSGSFSWNTTNVSPGTYTITAAISDGSNTGTGTAAGTVTIGSPSPPPPPTGGVTTAQGNSSVALSWTDGQTYSQVVVLDSTDGTSFNTLTTLNGSPTSLVVNYAIYGLTAGTAYFWKVRGFASNGLSADSSVFGSCLVNMTAPASNVSVTQGATVTLSWTGSATASASVTLRATAGGNTTTLASGQAVSGSFSWNTTGVAAGTYTITAAISDGSNTGTGTAAGTVTIGSPSPPPPPTGGVTTAQGISSVTLSWTDAQTYSQVVVLDSTDGTSFNTLATLNGSPASLAVSYATYGLTAGTAYFWKVRGVASNGLSADSTVFGSCLVRMTAPASNLSVTQGATVTLSWTGAATSGASVALKATAGGSTTTLASGQSVNGSYSWNTANVAAGTYTVSATISDGTDSGASASAGTVTVTQTAAISAPWSDGFESGSLATMGWTVSPNTSRWGVSAAASLPGGAFTPLDGTYSAWWYYSPAATNYDESLATPAISLASVSSPQLSYKLLLNDYSTATVESFFVDVDLAGSGAWTTLKSYTNQQGSFTAGSEVASLAAWAGQTVQVRFRVRGANSFSLNWWELDDVSITGSGAPPPPPQPPSGGVTTAQGASYVTISWTDVQTYSQVAVLDSTDGVSFNTLATLNGSPTSLTVSYGTYGLAAGTAYFWKVRGYGSGGLYADSAAFGSCLVNMTAPASNATVVQGTAVTLSWTGSATSGAGVSLAAAAGGSATTLATGLPASGSFSWDTTSVTPGTYTITATISDGTDTGTSTAAGTVTVTSPTPPPPPTGGVTTAQGSSYVTLNWTDAQTYNQVVVLDSTDGVSFNTLATLNGSPTSLTVNYGTYGLAAGTAYFWKVRGVAVGGLYSDSAAFGSCLVNMTAPASNVTVVQGATVSLTWSGSATASASVTLRATTGGTTATLASGQAVSASYSWNTTNAVPGTYTVTATISDGTDAGTSTAAGTVTVTSSSPPPPPTGGVTTAQGTSTVVVSWTDLQAYAQVVVLDSTDGTNFSTLATLNGSPTSLTVNYGAYGLQAGVAYFWKVRGVAAGGLSSDSGVFGSCLAGMTAPASNVSVAQGGTVMLGWSGAATSGGASVTLRATAGGSTSTIATGQPVSGSFAWSTTNVAAGTYTISTTISDGTNSGTSAAAGTVTVSSGVVTLLWSDDFESGSLATKGWTTSPGASKWTVSAAASTPGGAFTPIDGTYSAWWYYSPLSQNYQDSLVTPSIALAGSSPQVSYKLHLHSYSPATVESFTVDVSPAGSGSWTTLKTYTNQQGDFSGDSEVASLANWAGQTVQVRFRATGANSFDIWWWELDDVSVSATGGAGVGRRGR